MTKFVGLRRSSSLPGFPIKDYYLVRDTPIQMDYSPTINYYGIQIT